MEEIIKIDSSVIKGNLDIHFDSESEIVDGIEKSVYEILIHGDPEGLKSFANLILKIAIANQELIDTLPTNARIHNTLNPSIDSSSNSITTTVGRLDAKGTGKYYNKFISRSKE